MNGLLDLGLEMGGKWVNIDTGATVTYARLLEFNKDNETVRNFEEAGLGALRAGGIESLRIDGKKKGTDSSSSSEDKSETADSLFGPYAQVRFGYHLGRFRG